jgi:hypothetical protein
MGAAMINSLGHCLNRAVLVSMPGIIGREDLCSCVLRGIEASGLWLESAEVLERIALPKRTRKAVVPAVVFVPFTQIAYLVGAAAVKFPNDDVGARSTKEAEDTSCAEEADKRHTERQSEDKENRHAEDKDKRHEGERKGKHRSR